MEETMEETMDEGAKWYGSLRGGLQSSSGSDLEYFDGGSRLGIKGSAEVGEGLIAVYNFEHNISTKDAGLDGGGRLAYAGLAGGFGSLILGQIGAAAFNHTGVITDKSNYFGSSGTNARHGNALSYAHSTGPVSFQLDLIADGDMNTGQGIDKTEFGVTVGLGDIGSIALSHTNQRDTLTTMPTYWVRVAATAPATGAPAGTTQAEMITVHLTPAQNTANAANGKVSNTDGIALINRAGKRYFMTGASAAECTAAAATPATTDDCVTATAFVSQSTTETVPAGGGTPVVATTESYHFEGTAVGNVVATPAGSVEERGHKNTHLAAQFNVGGMTPYLGHSTSKENGAAGKTKTTHYGVAGGLGDTGINFLVAARSIKPATGAKTSPWLFGLSKSLGGGATVIFEHINHDDADSAKETAIGLHVNF